MASQADSTEFSMRVGRVTAPLREQAAAAIRRAILEFRFSPGQRLIERELIEQTGVSRTTIREVLRELQAEGLVTTIPQKGVVVVALTEQEMSDLYEVRGVLEAFAGRRFASHASDEQVAQLREGFEELKTGLRATEDIQERLAAKDRFYDILFEGSGNGAVAGMLGGLQARVRLMRSRSLSKPGRVEETLTEIEKIVEAIEQRDPDAAAAACEHHVQNSAVVGKSRSPELDRSRSKDDTD